LTAIAKNERALANEAEKKLAQSKE